MCCSSCLCVLAIQICILALCFCCLIHPAQWNYVIMFKINYEPLNSYDYGQTALSAVTNVTAIPPTVTGGFQYRGNRLIQQIAQKRGITKSFLNVITRSYDLETTTTKPNVILEWLKKLIIPKIMPNRTSILALDNNATMGKNGAAPLTWSMVKLWCGLLIASTIFGMVSVIWNSPFCIAIYSMLLIPYLVNGILKLKFSLLYLTDIIVFALLLINLIVLFIMTFCSKLLSCEYCCKCNGNRKETKDRTYSNESAGGGGGGGGAAPSVVSYAGSQHNARSMTSYRQGSSANPSATGSIFQPNQSGITGYTGGGYNTPNSNLLYPTVTVPYSAAQELSNQYKSTRYTNRSPSVTVLATSYLELEEQDSDRSIQAAGPPPALNRTPADVASAGAVLFAFNGTPASAAVLFALNGTPASASVSTAALAVPPAPGFIFNDDNQEEQVIFEEGDDTVINKSRSIAENTPIKNHIQETNDEKPYKINLQLKQEESFVKPLLIQPCLNLLEEDDFGIIECSQNSTEDGTEPMLTASSRIPRRSARFIQV